MSTTPKSSYDTGVRDGMAIGQRCANERWYWAGVFSGVLLAVLVIAAVFEFGGFR